MHPEPRGAPNITYAGRESLNAILPGAFEPFADCINFKPPTLLLVGCDPVRDDEAPLAHERA